jgi:hypothetical protein
MNELLIAKHSALMMIGALLNLVYFPSSAMAEITLPANSAIYGKVIDVSTEFVITIEVEDGHSNDASNILAQMVQNNYDPLLLGVLLEGRNVFCFPARQATTEQYLQLSSCYVMINNMPGFSEKVNFISLSFLMIEMKN